MPTEEPEALIPWKPALVLVGPSGHGHVLSTPIGFLRVAAVLHEIGVEWTGQLFADEYGAEMKLSVAALELSSVAPRQVSSVVSHLWRRRIVAWGHVAHPDTTTDGGFIWRPAAIPKTARAINGVFSVRYGREGAGWIYGQPDDLEQALRLAGEIGVPVVSEQRGRYQELGSFAVEGGCLSLLEQGLREAVADYYIWDFYWTPHDEEDG